MNSEEREAWFQVELARDRARIGVVDRNHEMALRQVLMCPVQRVVTSRMPVFAIGERVQIVGRITGPRLRPAREFVVAQVAPSVEEHRYAGEFYYRAERVEDGFAWEEELELCCG